MIVITGLRSGRALMMQTLKLLGFPVTGFLFHDDFCHKELNPKGYYDLPIREVINGLNTDIYKGKAVKLGGIELYRTNPKYVSKIIWCRRNQKESIKSICKMLIAEEGKINIEPRLENAELLYLINLDHIIKTIKRNDVPSLEIYYEEMILATEKTIEKVKEFLNIKTDINKAVLNVDGRELVWQ